MVIEDGGPHICAIIGSARCAFGFHPKLLCFRKWAALAYVKVLPAGFRRLGILLLSRAHARRPRALRVQKFLSL